VNGYTPTTGDVILQMSSLLETLGSRVWKSAGPAQ
jgi:hypothetical protein